jgi:hypothetical protein
MLALNATVLAAAVGLEIVRLERQAATVRRLQASLLKETQPNSQARRRSINFLSSS